MVQLDYIEQTGHGVPLIVSKYGRKVFDITENFITVTLPLNISKAENKKSIFVESTALTKTQQQLVDIFSENELITVKDLAKELNLSVTAINNGIKHLKEIGLLSRVGSKKNGRWVVHK